MIIILLCLTLLLSGCSVISSSKLTSDLAGAVTRQGSPIAGAVVKYNVESGWYGTWEEQVLVTDENGKFETPEWKIVRPFVLVHQPVIKQELLIEYEGRVYDAWLYTRMVYSDNGDPANGSFLICDLDANITSQKIGDYRHAKGICVVQEP